MKKSVYIICLCVLSVLVFYEVHNLKKEPETVSVFVPTNSLTKQVVKENKAKQKEIKNEKTKKVAYLTFDDGPSGNTKKVLRTLKEKKAVATFFLIGKEITGERVQTVKDLQEAGNVIGVHTYCHEQNTMYGSAECFLEDFDKAAKKIEEITGEQPKLHRFPWGSNNGFVRSYVDELFTTLEKRGVKSFDWNVSGEDSLYVGVPQETIFQNIKKDITRFDEPIILLHDAAAMDNTAAVLGQIIDYIREQGYDFDTLDHREVYTFPTRT